MKTLKLRDGDRMPALGLGTWKSAPGEVGAAVREAIRIGYRHVDCAWIYGNEAEIGEALQRCFEEGLVRREDLWITSKLWCDRHAPEDVIPALQESLEKLRLDALDLYLVHWPVSLVKGVLAPQKKEDVIGPDALPLLETWRGMERAAAQGLARHVGVSNFSAKKLRALSAEADHPPEVDQVELQPYLPQRELAGACAELGVVLTAYSPLGSGDRLPRLKREGEPVLLRDPVLGAIAKRHDKSPAQVILAWILARGISVIPKSVNEGRMRQNFEAQSLELSTSELAEIDALDRGYRFILGGLWAIEGGPWTLETLWDEPAPAGA